MIRRTGMSLVIATVLFAVGAGAADTAGRHAQPKTAAASRHTSGSRRRQACTKTHPCHSVVRAAAKRSTRRVATRGGGQRQIDADRAREIQQALIREKYLDGEPSGAWDQSTKQAMTRFQNDNGWQTKVVPDARALIKLGLGPKHAGLIGMAGDPAVLLPDSARDMRPGGGGDQR